MPARLGARLLVAAADCNHRRSKTSSRPERCRSEPGWRRHRRQMCSPDQLPTTTLRETLYSPEQFVKPQNFLAELKRRNVYKVAITYGVVAWLLIQGASILLPTFEAPAWVMKAFVVFLAFGFVISFMISWAFEATPEGLKRTENVPPDLAAKLPTWSRRKFATFVIIVAMLAPGLLAYQLLRP